MRRREWRQKIGRNRVMNIPGLMAGEVDYMVQETREAVSGHRPRPGLQERRAMLFNDNIALELKKYKKRLEW